MLYTHLPPDFQAGRIALYLAASAASEAAGGRREVFSVAVRFEAASRRVVAMPSDPDAPDAGWVAPAEEHPDGSITVRGPIPVALYRAVSGQFDGRARPSGPLSDPERWDAEAYWADR